MMPGLTVDTRIRRGDPTNSILAEVREGSYDLVVVGARQGVGLAQRLLGSVTQQVITVFPLRCWLPGTSGRVWSASSSAPAA